MDARPVFNFTGLKLTFLPHLYLNTIYHPLVVSNLVYQLTFIPHGRNDNTMSPITHQFMQYCLIIRVDVIEQKPSIVLTYD